MREPGEAGPSRRGFARGLFARRTTIAWGFVDQGFSSATNFGLSLLAGHLLGPRGLGQVFLGFAVYLFVLIMQRSLVTETLLAVTSALDRERRSESAELGLTLSLLLGLLATVGVLLAGTVIGGSRGGWAFLIAPWLIGTLVQDFWRSLLFRERRASGAAANDATWFVVMGATVPIAWAFKTEWAVVAVWGLGALGGAVIGFLQTGVRPASVRASLSWWWREAWPFGRWNAAAAIVVNMGVTIWAFVLAAIVGTTDLGGYRAVESLFAPLSLIGPAVALPGLPALARAYTVGYRRARELAAELSGIAVAASLVFFTALFLGGWRLLPFLFGRRFLRYRDLVVPIAAGQVFTAAAVGFAPLLKVERRGRFLLLTRFAGLVLTTGIGSIAAIRYGLIGAAWGAAIASCASSIILVLGALREPRSVGAAVPTGDIDPSTDLPA